MTQLASREISWAPGFTMNQKGQLFGPPEKTKSGFSARPMLPTTSEVAKSGIRFLAYTIGDKNYFVWRLLSEVWYGSKMILSRNGDPMRWDDIIVLQGLSSWVISDPEEIQFLWTMYCNGSTCLQLSKIPIAPKLYTESEIKSVIKDILVSGIR
ncbi:MAG: hypothetical protein E6Q97_20765 [Desulfurellales bacterium]|nr:MAG: hypothetical protein E6Q97_20765 [Desulfurellales bacterium]